METLLVALTPDASVENVKSWIKKWYEEKKREKRVVLLMVIERDLPASVSSWLMYVGFLGDRVETEMRKAIIDELAKRGREILEDIGMYLEGGSIPVEKRESLGQFGEILKKEIQSIGPQKILVSGIVPEGLENHELEVLR